MGSLFISAAHKSSGKTTITLGLCAALHQRGLRVRPFKKGPDYIDPMWLGKAAGYPCYNLDFHTMQRDEITGKFQQHSESGDISIIEGNKGLYDGLDLDGSNSTAALAVLLNTPVVLVIDAQGMTRGIAPLILGYQAFEPKLNIAGVILNKLGGSRHESKLRAVIEHYTDVPVIGAVHRDQQLQLLERHLGLIPSNEEAGAETHIAAVADSIARQVDLEHLIGLTGLTLAGKGEPVQPQREPVIDTLPSSTGKPLRIGIAQDAAFGFYYPDDLEAFAAAGAELVPIDTLHDQSLPDINGLFIGGGFPETQMQALQANTALRTALRNAIDDGLPVYAECGGLMYLSRSLRWKDQCCDMVGAIAADTIMHERPQGRGYVRLKERSDHPWHLEASNTEAVEYPAHEFHYSSLENMATDVTYAYDVLRGTGVDGHHDGIITRNVLACYTHFRDVMQNHWVTRFLQFVHAQQYSTRCVPTSRQSQATHV
jgi:cobyrinic acid a,c-diamide synthase